MPFLMCITRKTPEITPPPRFPRAGLSITAVTQSRSARSRSPAGTAPTSLRPGLLRHGANPPRPQPIYHLIPFAKKWPEGQRYLCLSVSPAAPKPPVCSKALPTGADVGGKGQAIVLDLWICSSVLHPFAITRSEMRRAGR